MPSLELKDGGCCCFLNAYGKNDGEVPEELRKFLQFIKANLEEREKDFEDSYVKQLQDSRLKIKQDREAEEQYMSLALNALLMDERDEGKVEGIAETVLEFLNALGTVTERQRSAIRSEKDLSVLKRWLRLAARADSLEQYLLDAEWKNY